MLTAIEKGRERKRPLWTILVRPGDCLGTLFIYPEYCYNNNNNNKTKEPNGLSISDNKRPEGLTPLSWQEGKPLAWDVIVICPLAVSNVSGYSFGASAEWAASRKCEKYANLPTPTFSSPQHLKMWAHLTRRPLLSFLHLGARSAPSLMLFVNPHFFSSSFAITLHRSFAREFCV